MHKVFSLLVLFLSLQLSFGQTYTQSQKTTVINGKKYILHTVEKGQSLYGIAKLYNTDLNTLIMENPGSIDGIRKGQELKIPTEKPKPQVSAADLDKYLCHTVAKGETVFSICQKYLISEQQLMQLNPDLKSGMKEGTLLKIREKTKTNPINPTSVVGTTTNTAQADTIPIAFNKPKKSSYTVGVFLPFAFNESELLNIDELVINKQNFPAAQQVALDFYEGLQKAADSLKSGDFSITFKIYDVGERDSSQVLKHALTDGFKNLDLVIGPMYNSSFKIISAEAKKLQIPCVSPLTQQNKVLFENPYTSKTTPSNNSLFNGLAAFCIDSLRTQNLVLVNMSYPKDQGGIKYFKQAFNERSALKGLKDTLMEAKGINGAKAAYKSDKLNYYILLSEHETPVSDFITHLNMFAEKKENIRVIGLRKWIMLDNLDLEYFNRFGLVFPTTYYLEYEDPFVKRLSKAYRDKYFTDAGDYYYYAADIGMYYFELLKAQGPAFCTALNKFPKKGALLNFDFYRPNSQTGFENQAVRIIRYTDYHLKRVN